MKHSILLSQIFNLFMHFRSAFSRQSTFQWACLFILASIQGRKDQFGGVSSFVRSLDHYHLGEKAYHGFLRLFHSTGIHFSKLVCLWVEWVFTNCNCVEYQGRKVLIADSIKIAKEGKKMPGVKRHYQSSSSNSKASYIFGHHFQSLHALVHTKEGGLNTIPLVQRIHEGFCKQGDPHYAGNFLDKFTFLVDIICKRPSIIIADAYYSAASCLQFFGDSSHHLISRLKSNAVAYELPPKPVPGHRGRPKKYGKKIVLAQLFDHPEMFQTTVMDLYGKKSEISYYSLDLLRKEVKERVRLVLVKDAKAGSFILITTDLTLDPKTVIKLYSARFKIEVSFKQLKHEMCAYSYRFWSKTATKLSRTNKNHEIVNPEEPLYEEKIWDKMNTYHLYVCLQGISLGIAHYLMDTQVVGIRAHFRGFLRTMKPDSQVSLQILRMSLSYKDFDFSQGSKNGSAFTKFIHKIRENPPPGNKVDVA